MVINHLLNGMILQVGPLLKVKLLLGYIRKLSSQGRRQENPRLPSNTTSNKIGLHGVIPTKMNKWGFLGIRRSPRMFSKISMTPCGKEGKTLGGVELPGVMMTAP